MSRIPTPAMIEAAPAAAQPLLQAVRSNFGVAPRIKWSIDALRSTGNYQQISTEVINPS